MRTIFRAKALNHYIQGREREVLPRYVAPPLVLLYWCLVVMLLGALLILCLGRIPVYSAGVGLVRETGQPGASSSQIELLLFFPANQQQQLHSEQTGTVQESGDAFNWSLQITDVLPHILSPAAVRQQFALEDGTATLVKQPVVVALARIHAPAGLDQSRLRLYIGSILQVRVETGSRTLLTAIGV